MIIDQLDDTSQLYRSRNPDWRWGLAEQLMAATVDALNMANWLNSEDGRRKRNRPEPIPRPGVGPVAEKKTFGATKMSFAEADAWLASDGLDLVETGNDLTI
jgi:hypothetical protein